VLLYPFKTDKLTRPLVEVPDEEVAFSFSVLRFAPPVPPIVEWMIAQNRALYEALRDVGGKKYPIGSIPFAPSDWVDHYGADYALVQAGKAKFDPDHVLTPGQGIFEPA
jgi:cytokinin dehydrogenase